MSLLATEAELVRASLASLCAAAWCLGLRWPHQTAASSYTTIGKFVPVRGQVLRSRPVKGALSQQHVFLQGFRPQAVTWSSKATSHSQRQALDTVLHPFKFCEPAITQLSYNKRRLIGSKINFACQSPVGTQTLQPAALNHGHNCDSHSTLTAKARACSSMVNSQPKPRFGTEPLLAAYSTASEGIQLQEQLLLCLLADCLLPTRPRHALTLFTQL